MNNPSLYLDRTAPHLNLCPYRSFRLTYRYRIARRSQSGVYAEVIHRKCGERTTAKRQLHMGTSTSPVCPYFVKSYTNQWACVYRDVSPTSQIRAEVRMKSGHSVFAKYREASEVIDLRKLFNDYWTSNNHEFTVLSQSLSPTNPRISNRNKTTEAVVIGKHSGYLQLQFSANDAVRMFVISHPVS